MPSEIILHSWLAVAVMAVGVGVAVTLRWVSAPYGRHDRDGWGPRIPSRFGWVVMESPAVLAFVVVYMFGEHALTAAPLTFATLWLAHYVHRAFIFPFRMRNAGKTMPATVAGMGLVFNSVNAYLNARWISHLGAYPTSWLWGGLAVVGLSLFIVGMAINLMADTHLLGLGRDKEGQYQIPMAPLFRWLSCPNYAGELLEWAGWAIATCSLSGLAFAVFTACNLVPRALSHHAWYRSHFAEYPRQRAAIIPFVL
ncbi:MAG: DUF1295 domain-containing protein [Myxococcota bacterium]